MSIRRKDRLASIWGQTILDALPVDGSDLTLSQLSAATGCPIDIIARVIGKMPASVKKIHHGKNVNTYCRTPGLCHAI
jgi:hypothetical protein